MDVRIIVGLAIVASIAMACSVGASGPTGSPVAASPGPNTLAIAADELRFSTTLLRAPAGEAFRIVFDNQESAPHNVSIYRAPSATEKILAEEPFGGPRVVTYELPALGPGLYHFRCDVHPDMNGTLTVE
jgi:plastocyanin